MFFLTRVANAAALSVELPVIGGVEPGSSPAAFINYVVVVAFLVAGFAAFIALIIGATRYLTAAGSPAAANDAKERIQSALVGLIFVFASISILYTINPDFVLLRDPGAPIVTLPTLVIIKPVTVGSCTMVRAYWSSNQSCMNTVTGDMDQVALIVEGTNCEGWGVSFNVADSTGNQVYQNYEKFGSSGIAQITWKPPQKNEKYVFTATAGSGNTMTQATSGELKATTANCVTTLPPSTRCGDPNLVCSTGICPALTAFGTSHWLPILNQVAQQYPIAPGINTQKFLEAIMRIETQGQLGLKSPAGACGLMQFMPTTARSQGPKCGKSFVGMTDDQVCDWLRGLNMSTAEQDFVGQTSICMASKYASEMHAGCWKGQIRDLAAGYNGGGGCTACGLTDCALAASISCPGFDCSNRPTLRYECLFDDTTHLTCNERIGHPGFGETRRYVAKFNACYF